MNTKTDELRALQDSVIQAAFDRWRKTEYPYAHPIQDLPAFHAGYLAALARQEEGREAVYQCRPKAFAPWTDCDLETYNRLPRDQYDVRILYRHPAPPSGGEGDAYAAGVKACIAWVEKRRHDFEAEYGTVDPTTNAMEFRNAALEEYDCELAEIEEGLRTLIATPAPQAAGVSELAPSWRDRADRSIPDGPDSKWHEGARDGMLQCAAELERALTAAGAAPEGWPARYACNGPEGTFWTDDAVLANRLLLHDTAIERDEWTVTDTQQPGAQEKA